MRYSTVSNFTIFFFYNCTVYRFIETKDISACPSCFIRVPSQTAVVGPFSEKRFLIVVSD